MGRPARRGQKNATSKKAVPEDVDMHEDDLFGADNFPKSQQQNILLLQAKLSRKRKRDTKSGGVAQFEKKAKQVEQEVLKDLQAQIDKFTSDIANHKERFQEIVQATTSDSSTQPSTIILSTSPSSKLPIVANIKFDYTKHSIYLRQQHLMAIADKIISNVTTFNQNVCELQGRGHDLGSGWEKDLETAKYEIEENIHRVKEAVGAIMGFKTKLADGDTVRGFGDGIAKAKDTRCEYQGITWMDAVSMVKRGVDKSTRELPCFEEHH